MFTTPYHPQGDAVVERMNSTLQGMLAKVVNENKDDWDLHLSIVCYAQNTSYVDVIQTTPFEAMLGRQAPSIMDHILPQPEAKTPSELAARLAGTLKETAKLVGASS